MQHDATVEAVILCQVDGAERFEQYLISACGKPMETTELFQLKVEIDLENESCLVGPQMCGNHDIDENAVIFTDFRSLGWIWWL